MKIMVLFGQRHCSYPGQYAPECLAVMSECDYSNNPEFLLSMRSEEVKDSGDGPPLYIHGRGMTPEEALTNANLQASHAKPIPELPRVED